MAATALDELVGDLTSFSVSNDENVSRKDLYKSKISKHNQESRRSELLERQKSDRQTILSALRNIEFEDAEDFDHVEGLKTPKSNPFKNQLMLSEWLESKPSDLEEKWLCKLAPVGHRTLIVAKRGRTSCYTKSGYRTCTFPSELPGGHNSSKSSYTLLDAIWSDENKTLYVLDMICYKSHPITNSEAEFRFYWGGTKFSEDIPQVSQVSKRNRYPMVWLPSVPCTEESIAGVLSQQNIPFLIDGIIFYHKEAHYTAGPTPLVGWLKPAMVNSVLGFGLDLTKYEEDAAT